MDLYKETGAVPSDALSLELEIRQRLFELQDLEYRDFHSKLVPNIDKECIIGVRMPALRKLAKEYSAREGIEDFLDTLPHRYYDEYNLHGFMISELKDYAETVRRMDAFLPYVDNWATCDLLSPKSFKRARDILPQDIERWLNSEHLYTVRFGIEMIMTHYLDEDFDPAFLSRVAAIKSDEYYLNMMLAWFFATALAKQWTDTIPYIENRRLDKWSHNKTIQKAIESYRVSDGQKAYLRTLKLK